MRVPEEQTSWEGVSEWYGRAVGRAGTYYHQRLILPRGLGLLELKAGASLLDLACGQGVLARAMPKGVGYVGVDASPSLIRQASRLDRDRSHTYIVADVTKPLPIDKKDFTHAALILSLQNIAEPEGVIRNARRHLGRTGRLLIVLNHPCFRIPRQTSWGVDDKNKIQYRRVDRDLSPLEVPIRSRPGRGEGSEVVWSYHLSLSDYSSVLSNAGFLIERIEEWVSDRRSIGPAARMENRAREEFPLFLTLLARKD
jgi:SAM-dependent methyltransferase